MYEPSAVCGGLVVDRDLQHDLESGRRDVVIGGNVIVRLESVRGSHRVKLRIAAPRDVVVHRGEHLVEDAANQAVAQAARQVS